MAGPRDPDNESKVLVGPASKVRLSTAIGLLLGGVGLGGGGAKLVWDVDALKKGQLETNELLRRGYVPHDLMVLYIERCRTANKGTGVVFPDFPLLQLDDRPAAAARK